MLRNDSRRAQCTYGGAIFNVAPPGTSGQGSWEPKIALAYKNTPAFARNCVSYINPITEVPNLTSANLGALAMEARTFVSIPLYMKHLPRRNPSLCCCRCIVAWKAESADVRSPTALGAAEAGLGTGQGSPAADEEPPSKEQKAANSALIDQLLFAAARNDIVALKTELAKAARNARLNKAKTAALREKICLFVQPSSSSALRSSGDLARLQQDLAELRKQLAELQAPHSLTVDAREAPLTVEIKDRHGRVSLAVRDTLAGLAASEGVALNRAYSAMLRVLSGVRVQQSGGKARSLTVTKTLKTEESAGPAVTLRSVVELGLVRQADLAVLMGGRDPYDPAVVAEAKRDEQLPFDIWSFDGASTW